MGRGDCAFVMYPLNIWNIVGKFKIQRITYFSILDWAYTFLSKKIIKEKKGDKKHEQMGLQI